MTLREFYREFRKVARGFRVTPEGWIRNRNGVCPLDAIRKKVTSTTDLDIMHAADDSPQQEARQIRRRLLQIIREERAKP